MAVSEWLQEALEMCVVTDDARDYLMGRGATPRVIEEWGIKVWDPPLTPCPDVSIHEYYGAHFERFEGKVIYPLLSPRGKFLGFDSRHIDAKDDVRYLLPESRWNPVWVGMPTAMGKIWRGCDVVVVEGRFDVFAMLQLIEANGSDKAVIGSGPAHLSWKQVEFLKRWCSSVDIPNKKRPPHVYMGYDNDDAGHKGSADAIKHLSYGQVESSRLRYGKPGEDPGAIWDRGGVRSLQENFPSV